MVIFIGLDNYENINCYFITTLQILHSSETLTKHIQNGRFNDMRAKFKTLMDPLIIYAEMKGTPIEIATNIRNAIKTNPPTVRDGYNWILLLNFYYFPIFYHVLGKEELHKILQEMSIEKRMIFTDVKMEMNEILPQNEIDSLTPIFNKYADNILDIIKDYNPNGFTWKVTALEMYIDDKYGHVAPVINENGILYIYDDHCKDTIYKHLIEDRKKLSDKIRLYYLSEDLIRIYNTNLRTHNPHQQFVINNYSYVFRDFDKYAKQLHEELKKQPKIEGGCNDCVLCDDIDQMCELESPCMNMGLKIAFLVVIIAFFVCIPIIYMKYTQKVPRNAENTENSQKTPFFGGF